MNTFEPVQIGQTDERKEKEIIDWYEKLCLNARTLFWNLEFYLGCPDKIELSVFFDFLNTKDPKGFLYTKWIEFHNIQFPFAMSIDKIIELDLVDVPKNDFNELLNWRKEICDQVESQINKSDKLNFYFPLQKLFDNNPENRRFSMTAENLEFVSLEFDAELLQFTRKYTVNKAENELLEIVNKIVESINELIRIGLIPANKQRWMARIENYINDSLDFDHTKETNPVFLNARKFMAKVPSVFFEKRPIGGSVGRISDVLKFTDSVPELLNNKAEDLFQEAAAKTEEELLSPMDPEGEQLNDCHEEVI